MPVHAVEVAVEERHARVRGLAQAAADLVPVRGDVDAVDLAARHHDVLDVAALECEQRLDHALALGAAPRPARPRCRATASRGIARGRSARSRRGSARKQGATSQATRPRGDAREARRPGAASRARRGAAAARGRRPRRARDRAAHAGGASAMQATSAAITSDAQQHGREAGASRLVGHAAREAQRSRVPRATRAPRGASRRAGIAASISGGKREQCERPCRGTV